MRLIPCRLESRWSGLYEIVGEVKFALQSYLLIFRNGMHNKRISLTLNLEVLLDSRAFPTHKNLEIRSRIHIVSFCYEIDLDYYFFYSFNYSIVSCLSLPLTDPHIFIHIPYSLSLFRIGTPCSSRKEV